MYSSIKELIEKLESEKKRLQDNFSQLADYEKEAYENQYQQVYNYFSSLIDLINNELNDEFLSGDVTEKYKKLRENWLRNIFSIGNLLNEHCIQGLNLKGEEKWLF